MCQVCGPKKKKDWESGGVPAVPQEVEDPALSLCGVGSIPGLV